MKKSKTTLPNTAARKRAQAKYNAKPEQKKRRAMRNKARREMIAAGKAKKGDGKDVHHKDGNPMNASMMNYMLQTPSTNRSIKRTKKAKKKDPTD